MKLNEQLSKLLKEHKISQQSLGEALGIRQATVSSWIQGRTEPSATDICKIADYFNVSTDYLFGRDVSSESLTEAECEIMGLVKQFTPFQQGKIAAMLQTELDKANGVIAATAIVESPKVFGDKAIVGKK